MSNEPGQLHGDEYTFVTGFMLKDDRAPAVYFAACHGHPEHEAWVDVILGTWGEGDGDTAGDHVTFSCRLRQQGAFAIDAPAATEGSAGMFGSKLTRVDALSHPWLGEFWDVIDIMCEDDIDVRAHISR